MKYILYTAITLILMMVAYNIGYDKAIDKSHEFYESELSRYYIDNQILRDSLKNNCK